MRKLKVIIDPIGYSGPSSWINNLYKRKEIKYYKTFKEAVKDLPDIIHYNWFNYENPIQYLRFFIKIFILKALRVKIIWTVHNIFPHNIINYTLMYIQRKFMAKIANGLTFFSIYDLKLFEKIFRVKVGYKGEIIHCGPVYFKIPNISKEEAQKIVGLNPSNINIVYYGPISWYKGVDDLIDLIVDLQQKYNNLHLRIIGKCKDPQLKKIIEEKLKKVKSYDWIQEFLEEEELSTHIIASDINAMLFKRISNSETFLLGKRIPTRILAPRMGSLPELDFYGEPSYFYDPHDKETLIKTFDKIVNDLKENSHKGNFIDDTQVHDEWDKIFKKLYSFYLRVLQGK